MGLAWLGLDMVWVWFSNANTLGQTRHMLDTSQFVLGILVREVNPGAIRGGELGLVQLGLDMILVGFSNGNSIMNNNKPSFRNDTTQSKP